MSMSSVKDFVFNNDSSILAEIYNMGSLRTVFLAYPIYGKVASLAGALLGYIENDHIQKGLYPAGLLLFREGVGKELQLRHVDLTDSIHVVDGLVNLAWGDFYLMFIGTMAAVGTGTGAVSLAMAAKEVH